MMEGAFVWQSTGQPIGPYLNWRNGIYVLSDDPRQNQGRGLLDQKLVKDHPPPQ